MKRFILILATTILLMVIYRFCLYKPNKPQQEVEKKSYQTKHSASFDSSINQIVSTYLSLKDAFVDADSLKIKKTGSEFFQAVNNLDTNLLRNDTLCMYDLAMSILQDMGKNASMILNKNDLTDMRKDFSSLTDVMYPAFFQTIHYEGSTLYLQNCPMAFQDEIPANWISNSNQIENPYLGKKHPVYKATMLHCGEVKDSIISK